jgi:hypothetical protein
MRRASFMYTAEQMRDQSKDVTRRLGWKWAKPGMRILAVSKCMGLRKGEQAEVFGVVEIVDVRRERLDEITQDDVRREGFPDLSCSQFQEMFVHHMRCEYDAEVTRVEFRHVSEVPL